MKKVRSFLKVFSICSVGAILVACSNMSGGGSGGSGSSSNIFASPSTVIAHIDTDLYVSSGSGLASSVVPEPGTAPFYLNDVDNNLADISKSYKRSTLNGENSMSAAIIWLIRNKVVEGINNNWGSFEFDRVYANDNGIVSGYFELEGITLQAKSIQMTSPVNETVYIYLVLDLIYLKYHSF